MGDRMKEGTLMNKLLTFAIAIILTGASAASSLEARQFNIGQILGQGNGQGNRGDRVCVYEHARFEGWEQCFGPGDQVSDLRGHNNKVSSIRIFGDANLVLFDQKDFKGNQMQVTNDIADLSSRSQPPMGMVQRTWNDSVESLRVAFDRNGNNNGNRNGNNNDVRIRRDPREGICVFDRTGFQGRSQCWETGDNLPDLTRNGGDWSDRISSIRVFGRAAAELYKDTRFRGERLIVDHDVTDLAQFRLGPGNGRGPQGRGQANGRGNGRGNSRGNNSWNDEVSSLRVVALRRNADNRRY
jgi:hypothetical protein